MNTYLGSEVLLCGGVGLPYALGFTGTVGIIFINTIVAAFI